MLETIFAMCHELLEHGEVQEWPEVRLYPASVRYARGGVCFLARTEEGKALWAAGGELPALFYGRLRRETETPVKSAPLDAENAQVLLDLFPDLRPRSHRGQALTLGLGDRLGVAAPGQLRAIEGKGIFPVLAQQSMRELSLTGRTYDEVLAAAVFGVLESGWTGGWGADGDHLKTAEEVAYALDCGFTMITLDCSEQIDGPAAALPAAEREARYAALPQELRARWETLLGDHDADGETVTVSREELTAIVLVYHRAVEHAAEIYRQEIEPVEREIDLELSIDETDTPTTPAAHYAVARILLEQDVPLSSVAPRFCGEFQKGIDYIGDVDRFTGELRLHAAIARALGYRLSVHSGSDKFAVFPAVGRETGGRVHVKTAGTSWLEAMRLVARKDPALYRSMHAYALEVLPETRRYYHISADPEKIKPLSQVADGDLPEYMDQPDARQVLHIAYGALLTAPGETGGLRFRKAFFAVLDRYEQEYAQALERHLGRHADLLRGE